MTRSALLPMLAVTALCAFATAQKPQPQPQPVPLPPPISAPVDKPYIGPLELSVDLSNNVDR